jgi:hypothetical protein
MSSNRASGLSGVGSSTRRASPAYQLYMRRAKTGEAPQNLRRMFDSSVLYFQRDHSVRDGDAVPHQFPDSITLTPGDDFCQGRSNADRWKPSASYWRSPTWEALNFTLADPHLYAYQYVAIGDEESATFTARAIGDLNCNGTFSTFERIAKVDADLNVIGATMIYIEDELE